MAQKPDGVQLPYGLSWAQWERFPGDVQMAIQQAQVREHMEAVAEIHDWYDLVERLQ